MREILVAAIVAASGIGPAAAAEWASYGNARFGYEIAVPPGFACGPEADNGDGRICRSANGTQKLTIWGGYLVVSDFDGDVADRLKALTDGGWTITYQATTPGWASFSGTKGQRVIYVREISACKGGQVAAFQLDYSSIDIGRMKPVVERLVPSLRQVTCE